DDPRASLRVVFALDTAMDVQHRKRLCIGQCRRFDRLHAPPTSLEVVLGGLLAFEKRAVQCDVAGLAELLRRSAQQRPPDVHRVPINRMVERGGIWQPVWMNSKTVTHLWHETNPINKLGEGVAFFLPDTVSNDMCLAGKPA